MIFTIFNSAMHKAAISYLVENIMQFVSLGTSEVSSTLQQMSTMSDNKCQVIFTNHKQATI
jgi:hypothetical protein